MTTLNEAIEHPSSTPSLVDEPRIGGITFRYRCLAYRPETKSGSFFVVDRPRVRPSIHRETHEQLKLFGPPEQGEPS